MGMILQGLKETVAKTEPAKHSLYPTQVRAAGGRETVGSGNNRTVVAKLSPLDVHFMVYTIRELFYQLTPPATASWKYHG